MRHFATFAEAVVQFKWIKVLKDRKSFADITRKDIGDMAKSFLKVVLFLMYYNYEINAKLFKANHLRVRRKDFTNSMLSLKNHKARLTILKHAVYDLCHIELGRLFVLVLNLK